MTPDVSVLLVWDKFYFQVWTILTSGQLGEEACLKGSFPGTLCLWEAKFSLHMANAEDLRGIFVSWSEITSSKRVLGAIFYNLSPK